LNAKKPCGRCDRGVQTFGPICPRSVSPTRASGTSRFSYNPGSDSQTPNIKLAAANYRVNKPIPSFFIAAGHEIDPQVRRSAAYLEANSRHLPAIRAALGKRADCYAGVAQAF